jgi:hypothetical protein
MIKPKCSIFLLEEHPEAPYCSTSETTDMKLRKYAAINEDPQHLKCARTYSDLKGSWSRN